MTALYRRCTSGQLSRLSPNLQTQERRAIPLWPDLDVRSIGASNRTTIGIVVPSLSDPFIATCARAVLTVANSHGYSVIMMTSIGNLDMRRRRIVQTFSQQINGLVIFPGSNSDLSYGCNLSSDLHIVTIGDPDLASQFDSVHLPNRSGAQCATEHLICHGHRSIAFLGPTLKLHRMKARYEGYRDAMIRAGYSPWPYVNCGSLEETAARIRSIVDRNQPPSALFAANSLTLMCVLKALSIVGIQVPRQIAIVGFDDSELAAVPQPPITVIRQSAYRLGEVAAGILFRKILGGEAPNPACPMTLPFELVMGSSCGCRPSTVNGKY